MNNIRIGDYEIIETIYSRPRVVEVFKAKYIPAGTICCLKRILVNDVEEATKKYSEIINSASIQHEYAVPIRKCLLDGTASCLESIIIVTDYYPEGDLVKFITKLHEIGFVYPDDAIIEFALQLISVLMFMQTKEICHRDIKPQNIFVDCEGKILKIGDFGSSRYIKDADEYSVVGTPFYMSPEMRIAYAEYFKCQIYNFKYNPYKSDVYSLGLVILYLATQKNPVGLTNLNTLKQDIKTRLDQIKNTYPATFNLLTIMLEVNDNERPDFIQLYSLITNSLFPKKNCSYCSKELTAITQIEFQNLFVCPKCYSLIKSPQISCEFCHSGKLTNEVITYDNKFYCRVCLSNVQTFASDKMECKQCNDILTADLTCDCGYERCHICKGPKHNESCYQSPYFNDTRYNPHLICECGELHDLYESYKCYYCNTNQVYYCLICLEPYSENHSKCELLMRVGYQI